MSRPDGFAVMDVDVGIVNDPKVRRLFRYAPDVAQAAFVAYVAVMGESWHRGRRVSVDDAWPAIVAFSRPAIDALIDAELLDARGLIPLKVWRNWYEVAFERRQKARNRWGRYNEKRGDHEVNTTPVPRGSNAATMATDPILPTDPTVRRARARATPAGARVAAVDARPLSEIIAEVSPDFVPPSRSRR